jgi:hypothetical protein
MIESRSEFEQVLWDVMATLRHEIELSDSAAIVFSQTRVIIFRVLLSHHFDSSNIRNGFHNITHLVDQLGLLA